MLGISGEAKKCLVRLRISRPTSRQLVKVVYPSPVLEDTQIVTGSASNRDREAIIGPVKAKQRLPSASTLKDLPANGNQFRQRAHKNQLAFECHDHVKPAPSTRCSKIQSVNVCPIDVIHVSKKRKQKSDRKPGHVLDDNKHWRRLPQGTRPDVETHHTWPGLSTARPHGGKIHTWRSCNVAVTEAKRGVARTFEIKSHTPIKDRTTQVGHRNSRDPRPRSGGQPSQDIALDNGARMM